MIEITDAVPMPAQIATRGRRNKYPFAELGVGDSFVVAVRDAASVRVSAVTASRKTGFKFTTRIEGDSVRIWRVS